MASKNQVYVRCVNGVLWWRFWNPISKLPEMGWHYVAADTDGPLLDEEWHSIFDDTPIKKLWTQDHNEDGQHIQKMAKENYDSEIITDIDDWYDDIPDFNQAKRIHRKFQLKPRLKEMHDRADRICCSTPFLVDKMTQDYGPKAHYAPNFVVPESWEHPQRKKPQDEVLLACATGYGRAGEIYQIQDALKRFLDEPNTKLLMMGAFQGWAQDYPPGKIIWSRFCEVWEYPQLLRWINPDIVISPLEHRDFNIAKSNIKWLESAMVGSCFVGERWGELERTIEDGVTGHLCDGIDEWTEKLVSLARDKKVRDRTSQAARSVVESDWTWGAVGGNWRAALGV